MDIWSACKERATYARLNGQLIRIVESQEQIATNSLVDDLEEQALLEEMLETSKPPPPPATRGLHYLLATPFRYPPLRHGSRFGGRYEASLFYGSAALVTALAETAYYRLVFWSGMIAPPPSRRLTTEHTAFGANYSVRRGLRLQRPPFDEFEDKLIDPGRYDATQLLGQNMREDGIEAFEYVSARDPARGLNIGLFTPQAFSSPRPTSQQTWLCDTREDEISFYSKEEGTFRFERGHFLVRGELPLPAL